LHAEEFGVRVVVLRTGLVLGPAGAAPRLKWVARLGMGGPLGPGTQRQPWIHLDDEVGLLLLALGDSRASGALNGGAPHAGGSAESMPTRARLARGPAHVRPPRWLLHSRLGASAMTVTHGRGAVAARALELGYEFRQPHLEGALAQALAA